MGRSGGASPSGAGPILQGSSRDGAFRMAENAGTVSATYDVLGNLRQMILPDGTYIQYLIDGQAPP